jgi:hypothetical protein
MQIVPCINPNSLFSKAFCWSNPHLFSEQTDFNIPCSGQDKQIEERWDAIRKCLLTSDIVKLTTNRAPNLNNVHSFKWLLTPNHDICQTIEQRINNIVTGDYDVIHVRLIFCDTNGVMHFNSRSRVERHVLDKALQRIDEVISRKNNQIVLLTDSFELSELAPKRLLRSGCKPNHSLKNDLSEQDVLDILTDLRIITGAKNATGICSFRWGTSGFLLFPCHVYNIPYEAIKI